MPRRVSPDRDRGSNTNEPSCSKVGRRLRVAIIRWRSIKSRGAAVGQRNVAEVREREPGNVLSRVKPWLKCSPRGEDLLARSWYARSQIHVRVFVLTFCRSNTHRIRWRGLVEIFFTPSWYTARIRTLNSTLTSNPSLKYSLHGPFVFCSEIYFSLSLSSRFVFFYCFFFFFFFERISFIVPLLWISLHCIIRFRTSPPIDFHPLVLRYRHVDLAR